MDGEKFLFSACALVNNQLFFVETQSGLTAMMDMESGDISYTDIMDGIIPRVGDVIDYMQNYRGKIYALEMNGNNITVFDLEKCQCKSVPVNCSYRSWGNFAGFERYGAHYYIFPKYENKIIVFDVDNDEISEIKNCFGEISEIQCTCRMEDKVWVLPKSADRAYIFNLQTQEAKTYKMEGKLENCVDAVFDGEVVYILDSYGNVYRWREANGGAEWNAVSETVYSEVNSMCRIVYAGNKLILLPCLGEKIKTLDLRTMETFIYQDYLQGFLYQETRWSKYYRNCEDDCYYYFAMRSANHLLKIRKNDGKLVWAKPAFPPQDEKLERQAMTLAYEKQRIVQEIKIRLLEGIEMKMYESEKVGIAELIELAEIVPLHGLHNKECISGRTIYEKVGGINGG